MKKEVLEELRKKAIAKIVSQKIEIEVDDDGDFTEWECIELGKDLYDINFGIYGGKIFISAYEVIEGADGYETNYDSLCSLI